MAPSLLWHLRMPRAFWLASLSFLLLAPRVARAEDEVTVTHDETPPPSPSSSSAEEAPPAPPPPASPAPHGWSLAAGPQIASLRGEDCSGTCNDHGTYAGLFVAPRYRVSPVVSLGFLGAYGWRPGSQGFYVSDQLFSTERRQLWRVSGELLIHGNKTGGAGVWFGTELGLAGARTSITSATNGATTDQSNTENGPVLGVALGFDVPLSREWVLGFEGRALAIMFGDRASTLNAIAGTSTWLTAGATLGYRFWE